jgi:hypothetical protein
VARRTYHVDKEAYHGAKEPYHTRKKTSHARQEISHCEKRPSLDVRRFYLADKKVPSGVRRTDAPLNHMISNRNHYHGKSKNEGRKRKADIGQHGLGRKYTNGTPGTTNYFHTNS